MVKLLCDCYIDATGVDDLQGFTCVCLCGKIDW